jgi:hypothetical protein
MKKLSRRAIPALATEAEEAEWWFRNRKVQRSADFDEGEVNGAGRGFEGDSVGGGAADSAMRSGAVA